MDIFFNYIGILAVLFTLFLTGCLIFKRAVSQASLQILLSAGSIFGICLYIFLLNLTAHIIKGVAGFWFALIFQIFLTFLTTKYLPSDPLIFPKGRELKVWIFLLLLWGFFLYQITAHAITDGADSTLYQSYAARFIKGDFPMHQPWQPDYIGFYHYGGSELIGALHALTKAPYYFIHPFIAFWMLLSVSQILTWIFLSRVTIKSIIIYTVPALVGLISLGGYFIAWPANLGFPSFTNLPTLSTAFEVYGSPANLDALILFLHRFLAICFFVSLLVLLLHSKRNRLSFIVLTIYLIILALTDESVFTVTFLPILIISFSLFYKKANFFIFLFVTLFLIVIQGGIFTETLLNRYQDKANLLLLPNDGKLPHEKYRTYRLDQQKGRYFSSDSLKPFNWYHPSIIWQLIIFLVLILLLSQTNKKITKISWLLFLSALLSLIAFHGLVPKGYTHPNGNRFLALSYYLSGLGIAFLIVSHLSQKNKFSLINRFMNVVIVWVLILSIIPPLLNLFPRKKENWFIMKPETRIQAIEWINQNIPKNKRIVALTDEFFSNSMNIALVTRTGALTPMWSIKPRVHDSFDIGPTYADLHFTSNPDVIKELKIDYILLRKPYIDQLPKTRQQDLNNVSFFMPVYKDENTIIVQVNPKFLSEGEIFPGTFSELDKIAPSEGTFCLDFPPNISANTYRILRLIFHNRKMYCDHGGAFYNARLDVEINTFGETLSRYDYLVLGKDVDPKTFCDCKTELIWSGLGNDIKFWKTLP